LEKQLLSANWQKIGEDKEEGQIGPAGILSPDPDSIRCGGMRCAERRCGSHAALRTCQAADQVHSGNEIHNGRLL